ncbi:MAG: sensor histidine kinase [Actinomycetia bacterium]|nr:sensor histidine kinase [Actinomycetes bacterium]
MAYFTTSIAVVAGLCLAFGILYVFTGIRRPSSRSLNLLFGFFALAYGGAIMTARTAFMSETIGRFAVASRISTVIAAAGFALLIWFVAVYTDVRPNALLWTVTGVFAIVGLAGIVAPDLVLNVADGVGTITLPWGETVLMVREGTAPLETLLQVALLVSIIFIVVADIRQFRRGDRGEAIVLAVGIGWFAFTIVEENLVLLGAIDFVFLSDFGFLGFVVVMGLEMVDRAIETEAELTSYKDNLEEMVEERSIQLEEAQHQLLVQAEEEATAAERNRLARELHDVITQLLFSINLIAGSLPRLWQMDPEMAERSTLELQRLTRGALSEMRTLLRELRPHTITDTDLATLVTHLTEGLAARHDIPAEINTDMIGSLPPEVHVALYRIAQEAMNNVAKHANSSSIIVRLNGTESNVHLVVIDDGYGFNDDDSTSGGMGMDIMAERATEIGANLAVTSEQDVGTTIKVAWAANAPSERT